MYYLQSRYYDPAIGRFINADTFATTDADGFLSCNMFAYCENNPITRKDMDGSDWKKTFGLGITIAVVGLAILAAIPTGGGSLALASAGITAASAMQAATVAYGTGMAIATGSLLFAKSNQSNEQDAGSSKIGKNRRVDYEYNGNGTGNVHVHTGPGAANKHIIWTFNNGAENTLQVAKTVMKIIQAPKVARIISNYKGIIKSLSGFFS